MHHSARTISGRAEKGNDDMTTEGPRAERGQLLFPAFLSFVGMFPLFPQPLPSCLFRHTHLCQSLKKYMHYAQIPQDFMAVVVCMLAANSRRNRTAANNCTKKAQETFLPLQKLGMHCYSISLS